MDQFLKKGSFYAFNKVHNKDYKSPQNDYIDIPTDFLYLESDQSVVTPNIASLVDSAGDSAAWTVQIRSKEVVGDSDEKSLLEFIFMLI